MAGYTDNKVTGGDYEFHIDTPNVAERIFHANNMARVITLQLDGDELVAALWGLANYRKDESTVSCGHKLYNAMLQCGEMSCSNYAGKGRNK